MERHFKYINVYTPILKLLSSSLGYHWKENRKVRNKIVTFEEINRCLKLRIPKEKEWLFPIPPEGQVSSGKCRLLHPLSQILRKLIKHTSTISSTPWNGKQAMEIKCKYLAVRFWCVGSLIGRSENGLFTCLDRNKLWQQRGEVYSGLRGAPWCHSWLPGETSLTHK